MVFMRVFAKFERAFAVSGDGDCCIAQNSVHSSLRRQK